MQIESWSFVLLVIIWYDSLFQINKPSKTIHPNSIFRAFMDDITILVPSKIAADDLLQRRVWRLIQRKVEAFC